MKNNIVFLLILGMISGCSGEKNNTHSPFDIDINQPKIPTVKNPTVSGELSPHAADLAEAVQQSQARLASARSDICPKLIEFKLGDMTQVRQNEIMRHQVCKYFMYPRIGDKISIDLDNKNMKAEMVQPNYFNFTDTVFEVTNPGKHVLQISYKNHHGDRKAENYNLTVINH